MKRALISAAFLAAGIWSLAHGQVSLPFPGPGMGPGQAPCTPNTQGGGTDGNVVALYHMDGNGNNSAGPAGNLTLQGTAQYSGLQFKFGTQALRAVAAGTTDYATIPAGLKFPNSDFTLEMWTYQSSLSGASSTNGYMADGPNGSQSPTFAWLGQGSAGGTMLQNPNVGGSAQYVSFGSYPLAAMAINTWQHYAVVFDASNLSAQMYINGVPQGTAPPNRGTLAAPYSLGNGTTIWRIGNAYQFSLYYPSANTFFDEVRISNMQRYTGTFTPATLPFCNVAASSTTACTLSAGNPTPMVYNGKWRYYLTNTGAQTITCPSSRTITAWCAAAGGGSGANSGNLGDGGGGAGGMLTGASGTLASGVNNFTIGAPAANTVLPASITSTTLLAGGAGGGAFGGGGIQGGASGGSGGGGAVDTTSTYASGTGGPGTAGQGFAGATPAFGGGIGGGGGGAGGAATAGPGGPGKFCPLDGLTYATGGPGYGGGNTYPGQFMPGSGGSTGGATGQPGFVVLQEG